MIHLVSKWSCGTLESTRFAGVGGRHKTVLGKSCGEQLKALLDWRSHSPSEQPRREKLDRKPCLDGSASEIVNLTAKVQWRLPWVWYP